MNAPDGDRATNLIWIDLEMTGLDTQADTIIEIATIVTDKHLNELAEGPVMAIRQSREVMDGMDEWNTRQHGESGLTARVLESSVTTRQAELATLEFLSGWVDAGASPMAGNTLACFSTTWNVSRHIRSARWPVPSPSLWIGAKAG